MSTIEWHHSKSDATTFNLTVYNKKTQELSALVLGDSPTFIFKEDEYIRTKESTMNEGKAPLQIDSRQLQLFGGKYWCVDNFYPNLSRRRNPNFIQPKIQSYNNVIGFVSCSDGGAKGMTENMIASIHQRMKNLSPTGVAEMFGRTGILNPRVVNAPPTSSAQQGDTSELGGQIISPLSRSSSSAFEETGESSDTASSNDQGGASAAYGADLTHRNTGTQNQQANSSNAASSSSVVVDLEEESSDEEEFDLETYGQSVEPNPSTNIETIRNHAGFDNFHMKIKKFGYTKKNLNVTSQATPVKQSIF